MKGRGGSGWGFGVFVACNEYGKDEGWGMKDEFLRCKSQATRLSGIRRKG
jgi:hypothetical protein